MTGVPVPSPWPRVKSFCSRSSCCCCRNSPDCLCDLTLQCKIGSVTMLMVRGEMHRNKINLSVHVQQDVHTRIMYIHA